MPVLSGCNKSYIQIIIYRHTIIIIIKKDWCKHKHNVAAPIRDDHSIVFLILSTRPPEVTSVEHCALSRIGSDPFLGFAEQRILSGVQGRG